MYDAEQVHENSATFDVPANTPQWSTHSFGRLAADGTVDLLQQQRENALGGLFDVGNSYRGVVITDITGFSIGLKGRSWPAILAIGPFA